MLSGLKMSHHQRPKRNRKTNCEYLTKDCLHDCSLGDGWYDVTCLGLNMNQYIYFLICLFQEGRTPLQFAAIRGQTKVAEVLLLLGADASILNKVC